LTQKIEARRTARVVDLAGRAKPSNLKEIHPMATNRGVVYIGPGKVEVQGIDYPKFVAPNGKVLKYNRQLMQAILHDKIQIAKAVNVTVIKLDDAPKGYVDFDKGAAKKFVMDPHAMLAA
jgi:hypothetical protein